MLHVLLCLHHGSVKVMHKCFVVAREPLEERAGVRELRQGILRALWHLEDQVDALPSTWKTCGVHNRQRRLGV